jgi:hypothetical protein
MVWFLERDRDVMVCEIRPARTETPRAYEFEIAPPNGPVQTLRFDNPSDLIDTYLRAQAALRAKGWRPRTSRIEELD